ncbi:MAG: leucine-rich repeat domain-containing protein [Atopobiaceae bacterium]|nr:leucine-rich repeat domain-containing protein [Atopobiaceae bacterium]
MGQISSGERIADRYVLLERIGAGGFGETWRAHDDLLNVDVAIKIFTDSDPAQRERYLREARSLAQYSRHRGIAAVRDYLATDDYACLIMEYVVGVDLVRIISANGALDLPTTLDALASVADALTSLHKAGLLHRDVSPDNIRIRPDGTGVLLDFGSVLATDDTMRRTIMVKPGYAPPEQYSDLSTQGPWTDVYALAATIYHALTGQVPSDSLKRTFADDLKRPSALGAKMPKAAEDALMRALELDYRARTKSVKKLMEGLHQVAEVDERDTAASEDGTRPQEALQSSKDDLSSGSDEKTRSHAVASASPPEISSSETAIAPGRRRHARPNPKRRILIAVGVAVAVVLAIVVVLGFDSSRTITNQQSDRAKFEDATLANDDLEKMLADPEVTHVELSNCVVTDEQIEQIAQKQGLTDLTMTRCTGFTTLAPLSECSTCTRLYLSRLVDADLGTLFPKDMPSIEKLYLQNSTIANLGDGLTRFPNLAVFALEDVEGVNDIGFLKAMQGLGELTISQSEVPSGVEQYLADMPSLYYVSLDACNLSSLDWTENCPSLRILSAEDNSITDISPLANHEELKDVRLSNNHVADITPLGSCVQLHSLEISNNEISDISVLKPCEKIWLVAVDGNRLQSLDGLENHDNLRTVHAQRNNISDASGLVGCSGLSELNLARNQLTDLDFCDSLVGLQMLDVSHCQVTDTKKLATCAKMKTLFLQDNQITDLSALQNDFTDLLVLNVATNKLSSLKDLAGCSALTSLVANDNQIGSLAGLEDKSNLEVLMLDSNQISDVSALSNSCAVLHDLDLGHNQVSSIDALEKMSAGSSNPMVRLLLDHNQIADVHALPKVKFNALVLHGNPLKDFSLLAERQWNALYLPYVEKANYGTLGEIGMLSSLRIVGVPYDKQVQTLRDMGVAEIGKKPTFLTEEEADDELQQVRDEVNKRVSGMEDESDAGETADSGSDAAKSDTSSSEEA